MNGYYTREHEAARENRDMIGRTLTHRASARANRIFDVLLALLALMVGALRDKTVRTVIRYSVVAVCFFCFIGLIGGIEQGLLSIGAGVVLGLLLIFVEILCLK